LSSSLIARTWTWSRDHPVTTISPVVVETVTEPFLSKAKVVSTRDL
jgi:hypothetical protein